MSKERARRRAEREREQAVKAAARAAQAERRERREARRRAVTSRLPRFAGPSGRLAQRQRNQLNITICLLAALNVVVWIAFHDWASRALALLVSVLAAPVLHMMLFGRR